MRSVCSGARLCGAGVIDGPTCPLAAAMIVCLCHRISDRDIRREVAGGVRCFEQLQDETRVASSCGSCHDCAREAFDQALGACAGHAGAERPAIALHAVPA